MTFTRKAHFSKLFSMCCITVIRSLRVQIFAVKIKTKYFAALCCKAEIQFDGSIVTSDC